jgi:protein-S-isoprenylcysteine O-methyltransferase Ste14
MLIPTWIAFLSIPLPDWFRFAMAVVSALSGAFTIWGYRTLGKNWVHALDPSQFRLRKEESLVTVGPYRYVRNPIYLGAFTLIVALAFLAANWLLLLPALFLVIVVYRQIDGEEKMLEEKFGDRYREYVERTPRIIPRFGAPHRRQREESRPK